MTTKQDFIDYFTCSFYSVEEYNKLLYELICNGSCAMSEFSHSSSKVDSYEDLCSFVDKLFGKPEGTQLIIAEAKEEAVAEASYQDNAFSFNIMEIHEISDSKFFGLFTTTKYEVDYITGTYKFPDDQLQKNYEVMRKFCGSNQLVDALDNFFKK